MGSRFLLRVLPLKTQRAVRMNDMSEKRVNPQLTFALRICKNFFAPAFMLRRQMPFCKDAALVAVADVYTEMISNASNLKVAN